MVMGGNGLAATTSCPGQGLVADHDLAAFRDALQAQGQVRLGADDGVVHAVVAAEISDVAEAGVDAHAHHERSSVPPPRKLVTG